jgi:prepilin-type processing-associated H-X9-DG protein
MKIASEKQTAFTRTDLVAIIAIVAGLGVLTLPLHGDATTESSSIICRTNKRQLIRALHLYTMDNGGLLPPNGGDSTPGRTWVSGFMDFTGGVDSTNFNTLTTPTTSLLANYLDRSPRPFKCPADLVAVRDRTGRFVQRVRSVSMNNAVGTDPQQLKNPAPGMWLDGNAGHTANQRWRCFGKLSDMVRPTPADLFVVLDEHPDSINDSMFGSVGPGPSNKRWIDIAAAYHNGGAGFGMADGSAQIHRWLVPASRVSLAFPQSPPLPASLPDLLWLADRTSALITDQP